MTREERLEEWIETVAETEPELITYDGLDDAIIGLARQFTSTTAIAYDLGKVIEILIADGMTREDAVEHFHFNILGGWVGLHTPIFVERWDSGDEPEMIEVLEEEEEDA